MMKNLLLVSALALLCSAGLAANEFHPEFPLRDDAGELLVNSGAPLSTRLTCGGCHDVVFIEQSSDHAAAGVFEGEEIDWLIFGPMARWPKSG
jgi:cytochrome c553